MHEYETDGYNDEAFAWEADELKFIPWLTGVI